MTAILKRRRSLVAALLVVLAAAALFATTSLRGATAQEPIFTVFFFADSVTASNGNGRVDFEVFPDETLVFASCTGRSPRGGGNIPGQVVTQFIGSSVLVRILHVNGTVMNATVTLNCTVGVESPAPAVSAANRGLNGFSVTK